MLLGDSYLPSTGLNVLHILTMRQILLLPHLQLRTLRLGSFSSLLGGGGPSVESRQSGSKVQHHDTMPCLRERSTNVATMHVIINNKE